MKLAAFGGHRTFLRMFERDGKIQWHETVLNEAARGRHWGLVHWLYENSAFSAKERKQSHGLAAIAFEHSNLKELKWAVAKGFGVKQLGFWNGVEADWAAHTKVFRYVVEKKVGDTRRVVGRAVEHAAQFGDLEVVKWLVLHPVAGSVLLVEELSAVARIAAGKGHIAVVQWLVAHVEAIGELPASNLSAVMFEATKNGRLEVVRWLYEGYSHRPSILLFREKYRGFSEDPTPVTAMDAAAANGHVQVLELLNKGTALPRKKGKKKRGKAGNQRARFPRCTAAAMDAAAANGHLNAVKWLHVHRTEGCTTAAMDRAAANGYLEVVKWLHLNRYEGCTRSAIDSAASRRYHERRAHKLTPTCCRTPASFCERQLAVVQWLATNRSEGCTSAAMDGAAANGNLPLLRWLHENTDTACTENAMTSAARLGRLDVVQWIHEYRPEGCSTSAVDSAATEGHFDVLKWLCKTRSDGGTYEAIDGAAGNGHLRVVQWLHDRGAPHRMARMAAIMGNHIEVTLYLKAHIYSDDDNDDDDDEDVWSDREVAEDDREVAEDGEQQ